MDSRNYIFTFTQNEQIFVKVINAPTQISAVKKLANEYGELHLTSVLIEGVQPTPDKTFPPIFTGVKG